MILEENYNQNNANFLNDQNDDTMTFQQSYNHMQQGSQTQNQQTNSSL